MSDNRQSRMYYGIPFLVNISELSSDQIDDMINTLMDDFGATAIFGKDIFMEVVQDHQIEAADPMKFQRGPFVGLEIGNHGKPKLISAKDPKDINGGGVTIYGHDQFLEFAKAPETFMSKAMERHTRRKHSHDTGMGMG